MENFADSLSKKYTELNAPFIIPTPNGYNLIHKYHYGLGSTRGIANKVIATISNSTEEIDQNKLDQACKYYEKTMENMDEADKNLMTPVIQFINHVKSQLSVNIH